MINMTENINTVTMYRFLSSLIGIGKTHGMIENVKNFIDETLMFKKDFEVCVICPTREELKHIKFSFTDYYNKYIDLMTFKDILYKISSFPLDKEDPYNFPRLDQLFVGKHYEKYFIDPSCYEIIIKEQLQRFKQISELL